MKMYKNLPLDFPFLSNQRTSYPLTIATSSSYQIQLNGLSGLVNCMFITVRATTITSSNIGTYVAALSTIDIQDSNGNSVIGYYACDVADMTNFQSDQQLGALE